MKNAINPDAQFTESTFPGVRHFARWMLQDNRLLLRPDTDAIWAPTNHPSQPGYFGLACILFRNGPWQVELIAGLPNAKAPPHAHPNVDSVDVILCGGVVGHVDARRFVGGRGNLPANLVRIPAGMPHGGAADETGVVYLSFQKWKNGIEPSFIGRDWVSADG